MTTYEGYGIFVVGRELACPGGVPLFFPSFAQLAADGECARMNAPLVAAGVDLNWCVRPCRITVDRIRDTDSLDGEPRRLGSSLAVGSNPLPQGPATFSRDAGGES